MSNSITLYSNGIGIITRTFSQKETQIRVRRSHLGDIISSFRLLGDARLLEPISWPMEEKKSAIEINSENAQVSLIECLTGRQVSFNSANEKKSGINMGIQAIDQQSPNGPPTTTYFVVLLEATGINRYLLSDIQNLNFTEDEVKKEINNSLAREAIKLRPDSTFITLKTDKDNFAVQYSTPFPAWTPTYRFEKVGSKYQLACIAKVDYEAEEDLPDCLVTLIVGEPDTYEKEDLATPVIPQRNKVKIVKDKVDGGKTPLEGNFETLRKSVPSAFSAKMTPLGGGALECGFANEGVGDINYAAIGSYGQQAETVETELEDYSTWTSKNSVTLKSNKTSLIYLFVEEFPQTEKILYYNENVHKTRPKLAMRFRNTQTYSLGKGPCTVFENDQQVGECIFESVKPGQYGLLLYGTDNSVRVQSIKKDIDNVFTSLTIKNGVATTEHLRKTTKMYRFNNLKKEGYKGLVDHTQLIPNSVVTYPGAELVDQIDKGVRLSISIPPGETILTVNESVVVSSSIKFVEDNWESQWGIWQTNGRLQNNKDLQTLVKAYASIHNKEEEIEDNANKQERLTANRDNLLKLLEKPTYGTEKQRSEWQVELGQIHTSIKELQSNEDVLNAELKKLKEIFCDLSQTTTITWSAG